MTEPKDWFASCKEGHPDDHWQLDPLCHARTLVGPHWRKPTDPPICGIPRSNFEHNDSPAFDADSAERKHEFVMPPEPLVWGENAWRKNDCPGHVRVDPEYESGEMVFEGIDASCSCPCHRSQHYVNVYRLEQGYGGPEEGGWWYEAGTPIASIPFATLREAEVERDKLKLRFPETKSRYSTAPREDDFGIYIENDFGAPFPEHTPRYE